MKDLAGKVAVITGGASGIGLAMAEAFGAESMRLVIADIEQVALDGAVAGLRAKGFDAVGVRCDVARYEDVQGLARATLEAFGKAHLVVNNAGVSITGPMWDLTLDDWRWVFDVNVWGVVHGIRAFTPILLEQGEGGHIINTASEAAFIAIGHHAPYCASKAAVVSLSLALRSELEAAVAGVGVSVVCPGMVDTQIHRSWRNRPRDDQPWSLREREPEAIVDVDTFQARGVQPSEIAALTLQALKENRFYVFNTPHWREMIRRLRDNQISGENPPVRTWGPDRRADEARPPGAPRQA
jgi:NAD(P)-dependent dehydrogenase (short-subunit alcohol dehydrogenase family)